jgi:DNA repair protein RecO (recombination protein O)
MLIKSAALVLKKTPYSDNSAIFSIFTQSHGILTFMVQGMHGKSGKAAILQPGNLIEMVFYYQNNRNLKRIKEIRLMEGFGGYSENPVQLQVMTFCVELLQKSLPEEQEDPAIFSFVAKKLVQLAKLEELSWFPLKFLLDFAEVSGLGLQLPTEEKEGYFLLESNENSKYGRDLNPLQYLDKEETMACSELMKSGECALSMASKRLLTEKLLYYFKIHLFPDKEIRSFPILMEVLS